jgi:DNA polymerase I
LIYLIDASVYVFRAYYSALPEFLDRDGEPARAVYGFARFLGDLIERVRPAYMAVAFDQSLASSFRNRIYPPYKANREPAPPGLALQFERCFEFCTLAGVTALGSAEYEADDILGSLAARMRAEEVSSTLVSRDKDLAQLVREGDVFWDYAARDPLSYFDVKRRYGVAPERFADYLALTGDAVDNIPGVPGVGPKTAAGLMQEFASLDELYQGIDRVAALKVRGAAGLGARLLEHREAAYLARQLTGIVCDMPLAIETRALRRQRPDLGGLMRFFDRQAFGPLLRRQAERLAQLPTPC